MARRIKLTLCENDVLATGTQQDWPGGEGALFVDATFGGGSVKLEQLSATPGGATWLGVPNYATTTPVSLTANGIAQFRAPAGKLRVSITTATAVNAYAVGIPAVVAG